jgi:hypothetical protein
MYIDCKHYLEEYMVERDERLREFEERYEGYEVYDNTGEKIGKVDDLFIDETDREEYIGVKMGLFGLSGTTLIPMEIARVDDRERRIEVAASKDHVKDGPHYSDEDDIDLEFEARIRNHFELEGQERSQGRGTYGRYVGARVGEGGILSGGTVSGGATSPGGIEDRDLVEREPDRNREDLGGRAGRTGTTGAVTPTGRPSEPAPGARGNLESPGTTDAGLVEEGTPGRDVNEPLGAPPPGESDDRDLVGGQRGTTPGAPEIGGTGERFERLERDPGRAESVDVGSTEGGAGGTIDTTGTPGDVGATDLDLERDIRTGDRPATEPLGSHDEPHDVPLDQPTEGMQEEEDRRIRVRRRSQPEYLV